MSSHDCILCESSSLSILGEVNNRRFHQSPVHKSIPVKSIIYQCACCGHTQKYHGQKDQEFLQKLYDNYTVGNFSVQVTQSIFINAKKDQELHAKTREEHVLDYCSEAFGQARDLLDIGCGTGSFLRSVAQRFPAARLHAYEVTESYKSQLLAIKNVVSFSSGHISELPRNSYDFITLWQCLEHLDAPGKYLKCIHELLSDGGHLLIQVPDLERMPFDLSVFEHWSHFYNSSLIEFVQSCGFELIKDGHDWVYNCSTILLKKTTRSDTALKSKPEIAARQIKWLNDTAEYFETAIRKQPGDFLILGMGTAAGWLYGLLDRRPVGILEEDRARVGLAFDQIPVIAPESAAPGSTILIPFAASQAAQIKDRLQKLYANLKDSVIICAQERY